MGFSSPHGEGLERKLKDSPTSPPALGFDTELCKLRPQQIFGDPTDAPRAEKVAEKPSPRDLEVNFISCSGKAVTSKGDDNPRLSRKAGSDSTHDGIEESRPIHHRRGTDEVRRRSTG
jgi:hypothetical protein